MQNEETSKEERWKSIRHQSMDELAQEIGRLCMYWSELELAISVFLSRLLQIPDKTSNNVVIGSLDFRAKLHALLPLAFERKTSDDWYERLAALVNHIDFHLRTERNRVVHDYWIEMPGEDEPHRMRFAPKVVNTQSRTKSVQLATFTPFTEREVGLLYVDIIDAKREIETLSRSMFGAPKLPNLPDTR